MIQRQYKDDYIDLSKLDILEIEFKITKQNQQTNTKLFI